MKLLVFGTSGQVATALQRAVPKAWNTRFLSRTDANLERPDQCAEMVRSFAPDAVINAAAYTAVDKAEEEQALAHTVNADAPAAMAQAAKEEGAAFLHISTDYVFDGSGTGSFKPSDPTGPLGVYGTTKLAGENAVAAVGGDFLILRTSWVVSGHGANFVKTMLKLGGERGTLNVVDDQIGGPTPASAIAEALITCAEAMRAGQSGGVYHLAGAPFVSWAGFAEAIMKEAELNCQIDAIDTSGYPTPAQRPANSRLDCASLKQDFGIARPDWRAALPSMISELRS